MRRSALRCARLYKVQSKKKTESSDAGSQKKKLIKRIEHKMAAVARDRARAQSLAELQQLEAEKAATS
ncbi:hypothetical protein FRX31_024350 [Thalictrum thalictroides]|uniref:Uncharacterized protein n=1 Tax=Thalictrum thalictroides TaxID=46969 RepID=A0A7J6VMA4_THATH|nr:hypothetical protein FRX31_024350 [Thalictrum thalictroides]